MMPTSRELLLTLEPLLEPSAQSWLASSLAESTRLMPIDSLRITFARAARKLGGAADRLVAVAGAQRRALDVARALLLLGAVEVAPAHSHVDLVDTLFRGGEQREQQAILMALPLLPEAARFSATAIHACRTNSLDVFRAIACDNPFPADHFPELHFNQLVLKAIFLGVEVARIERLAERVTPELVRMLREYASERRAAGRPIPSDVDYVVALQQ